MNAQIWIVNNVQECPDICHFNSMFVSALGLFLSFVLFLLEEIGDSEIAETFKEFLIELSSQLGKLMTFKPQHLAAIP